MTPPYSQKPHPFTTADSLAQAISATQDEQKLARRSFALGTALRLTFIFCLIALAVWIHSWPTVTICLLGCLGTLLAQATAAQEYRDNYIAREVREEELRARWKMHTGTRG